MRCPNCRKRIPANSSWCESCGFQKPVFHSGAGRPPESMAEKAGQFQAARPPKKEVNVPRIILSCVIAAMIIIPIVFSVITVTGSMQQIWFGAQSAVSSFTITLPAGEQSADTGVTRDNYDMIHPGMSYGQVVKLFGVGGAVSSSDGTSVTYAWVSGSAVVTVEFVHDSAVRKDQSGL
jgi:hypothetical protein